MSSLGSVITRVYTSNAYLPLSNAPVSFTERLTEGTKRLLAVRLTDQSGLTAPVWINTPNRSASLQPEPENCPYAELDIQVEYPGYSSLLVEGVQVFPNVETIQGLQLRPLSVSRYNAEEPAVYGASTQNL